MGPARRGPGAVRGARLQFSPVFDITEAGIEQVVDGFEAALRDLVAAG